MTAQYVRYFAGRESDGVFSRLDRRVSRIIAACGLLLIVALSGCASPYSVTQLSINQSYYQTNRSSLTGNTPSNDTLNVLRRHGLLAYWRARPVNAIALLRADVVGDPSSWQELLALADLSYLQAKRDNSQPEFLAAAVYAYAYIAPAQDEERANPFERQFHQACDIYNLGLAWGLTPPGHGSRPILSGIYSLPFGNITLTLNPQDLAWRGGDLISFQSTANLQVNGIENVYSAPGIGAPLAAEVEPSTTQGQGLQVSSRLRVPTNLLMVIDHPREQVAQADLTGRMVIHTIYDRKTIAFEDNIIPLSYDQSATLALSLSATPGRLRTLLKFLNGRVHGPAGNLIALEPHQYGFMPVIFIHGTTSSPVTWADMANDLLEIPAIRDHFEFWFFSYPSGNPIAYSALQLRTAIQTAVAQLGGVQADPALGRITLIGHSQGGLLAKMLVIDSGNKLWDGMDLPPLDRMKMSENSRRLLQQGLFLTPVPEVQRVIFISTPHRGSFVAGLSIAQLLARLITLPIDVTQIGAELFGGDGNYVMVNQTRLRMSSVGGMSPRNPFIKSLAEIPIAPGIHVHSIISVSTSGPVEQGNDGVVSYASAHIPDVDSELVVRSGHSTLSNPATIAEVQRILLRQLASSPAANSPSP
jgi:pimeloyl-ACP methyl ester carboxylesterase